MLNENEQVTTKKENADETISIIKAGKSRYCELGWKYALFAVIVVLMQYAYAYILPSLLGEAVKDQSWYAWMQIAIPVYAIAFPILYFLLRNTSKVKMEQHKISLGKYICCIFMAFAIWLVGTIIGTIVNLSVTSALGISMENSNALGNLILESKPFFRILTVGILAPIFEELIFRKFLIERIVKHGEWAAIVTSGLLFGLFHGNFSQFFFAMGLGMFYAFIYIRSGKVWYTMLLHAIQNLTASVVTVWATKQLDQEKLMEFTAMDPSSSQAQELLTQILPGMIIFMGWLCILILCGVVGIILWCCFGKRAFMKEWEGQMPKGKRFGAAYGNWGMLLYLLVCIAIFVICYASMAVM